MKILNPENFKLMKDLKYSGLRILKFSKITYLWIFRIQDPESSGLRSLNKGPWILRIWYPQFCNTIITCQGHISKVVQNILNSKGYLKKSQLWQGQIWVYEKRQLLAKLRVISFQVFSPLSKTFLLNLTFVCTPFITIPRSWVDTFSIVMCIPKLILGICHFFTQPQNEAQNFCTWNCINSRQKLPRDKISLSNTWELKISFFITKYHINC